jgi:hypothetical protein
MNGRLILKAFTAITDTVNIDPIQEQQTLGQEESKSACAF